MKKIFAPMALLGIAMLTACSAPMPVAHTPAFAPVVPVARDKTKLPTGAIFASTNTDMWQARRRDYQVGDIITVLLDESTQAARTLNNETSRESTNDAVPAGLNAAISGLGGIGNITNGINTAGASITNKGKGVADQRASLSGSIAVTVTEVQENGNLVLRGEKQLSLSEGGEVIQVSGIIRAEDVSANSTVLSRRLANAQISYRGVGDLANATRVGWGTGALLKFWPF